MIHITGESKKTAGFRGGYTTGACAAAASKAAALFIAGKSPVQEVFLLLPDGEEISFPVAFCESVEGGARAGICKDGGDDPDVTTGLVVVATVCRCQSGDITFSAGEGVGTVTLPGLSVPVGEPAINPVPRAMIRTAVRQVTDVPLHIVIEVPGGKEIAEKTYNPRLGIQGGISIIGTTGHVRPYSVPALRESLRLALDVAIACGTDAPVFVPGNIGRKAALGILGCDDRDIVDVSNEWGYMLDAAVKLPVTGLCLVGHPGKLAKLAAGEWDTHSSRSGNALDIIEKISGTTSSGAITAEGYFAVLPPHERLINATLVATAVKSAVTKRCGVKFGIAVVLNNMKGELLGSCGDITLWKR